jgi:hypothetical protein
MGIWPVATDPSQRSLFLKDWKTSPLTVSDLTPLQIKNAEFAYLSACHTYLETSNIELL